MHFYPAPEHAAVVNRGVIPNCAIVADLGLFADYHVMTRLKPCADLRRGVNDRARADARPIPDPHGAQDDGSPGAVAQQRTCVNRTILTQLQGYARLHRQISWATP